MAIVNPQVKHAGPQDGSTYQVTWGPLTTVDTTGAAVQGVEFADRSVQVSGTFGVGGTVSIEGSNDGVNFFPLTDPQGNPISITVAGGEQIEELVGYMRPVLTGGDATTSLTVTCVMKRQSNLRT